MRSFQNAIRSPGVNIFTENPNELKSRLFSLPSLWEFAALSFNVFALGVFIYLGTTKYAGYFDYEVYLQAGRGNFSTGRGFYYAYWILPFLRVLSVLPFRVGLFLWGILNILGTFIGARIFGDQASLVLFSYQALSILFGGQITGIIIGGVGVLWIGLKLEIWLLAAVGLLVASTKYHIGGLFSLLLLLFVDKPLEKKLRVILLTGLFVIISLIKYPGWPIAILQRIQNTPPNSLTNISLWHWLGPVVLLLWIPPLLTPLSKLHRLIALMSALCLAIPYFQQYDLIMLFVLPLGWLTWLGVLGYGKYFFPIEWLQFLVIIPMITYFSIFFPWVSKYIRKAYKSAVNILAK